MKDFSSEQISVIADRARALGEPTRVRILMALARGEQAVGQIAQTTAIQQSTVSKHLQVLFHAGLVERRRSAATVFYWLASPDLVEWLTYLGSVRVSRSGPIRNERVRIANAASTRRKVRR